VLTDNPVHGITRNPWNPEHTPGGSSGGGSASLAAGVTPLAVGTDGGGSIRCPASCVGAVGLKGTLGGVPYEAFPDGFGCFAFAGPLARTAADVALMYRVMAGPTQAVPWSLARPTPSGLVAPDGAARGLRIGWIEHVGGYRTTPEVGALCAAALTALAGEGATVTPLTTACFDGVFESYRTIATSAHTRMAPLVAQWGEAITPAFRASVEIGMRWTAAELVRAQDRRTTLLRDVDALFAGCDLIATPTLTAPPALVDAGGAIDTAWYAEWAAPLYPFNLTGHPAASVPAGFTADGLPVGVQLVAPWDAEQRILDVAALLEAKLGLLERRPPI
jgi:aspartyl-tRNA(Asn)/glutamyl-tRNA(Gln) amidotransferase subunit A